ncbi:hypothetical protein, conserved [Eimeria tenella]|uniref:GAF domain-containing protein n=1 Tax=Eimeria tenella TaxID=5802 RepID=U6KNW6_EIMTE|nr:hypothetical protein, conserved [Eimeria tenella]CDJ37148.1 hypothetical protein, conserved [Eimeria tenella]|eukprot:XP_013227986.1 hypothetical protein, conserved [Eimeria tenella]
MVSALLQRTGMLSSSSSGGSSSSSRLARAAAWKWAASYSTVHLLPQEAAAAKTTIAKAISAANAAATAAARRAQPFTQKPCLPKSATNSILQSFPNRSSNEKYFCASCSRTLLLCSHPLHNRVPGEGMQAICYIPSLHPTKPPCNICPSRGKSSTSSSNSSSSLTSDRCSGIRNGSLSKWDSISEAAKSHQAAAPPPRPGSHPSSNRNSTVGSSVGNNGCTLARSPFAAAAKGAAAEDEAAASRTTAASGEPEYMTSEWVISTRDAAAAAAESQIEAVKAAFADEARKAAAAATEEEAELAAIVAVVPAPVAPQWIFRRPADSVVWLCPRKAAAGAASAAAAGNVVCPAEKMGFLVPGKLGSSSSAATAANTAAMGCIDIAKAALAGNAEDPASAQRVTASQEPPAPGQAEAASTPPAAEQPKSKRRRDEEANQQQQPPAAVGGPARPSPQQLWMLVLAGSIPFIGFGFVDNFVMITAGDMFDTTLCVSLGLSTMAAAALGNWLSDLLGIWMGSWIESLTTKFKGIPRPNLTKEQLDLPLSRRYYYLGSAIGISLGCLLGMVPLLLLDTKEGARLKTQKDEENFIFVDLMQELEDYMQAAKVVFYRVDMQNKCFRTVLNGKPLTLPLDAGIPGEAYRTGKLVNWRPPQKEKLIEPQGGDPSIACALHQQQQHLEQVKEQQQQKQQVRSRKSVQPEELHALAAHLQKQQTEETVPFPHEKQEQQRAAAAFLTGKGASLSPQQQQQHQHQTLTDALVQRDTAPEQLTQTGFEQANQQQRDSLSFLANIPPGNTLTRRLATKQILGAPVFGFQGDVIGVIEVMDPVGRACFSREDSEFLISISSHLAVEFEGKQHMNKILE